MMKPVKKIKPQDWMVSKETTKVMKALSSDEGKALFVGGCVRNMLLKIPVGDIDIATQFTPKEVMKRLENMDIKAIPTGIDHGTITAVINKKHYEITTLRRDVATDGRRAVVAFTDDWKEDAQRRDFTLNTLLADAKGQIFDPTGRGIKDLEARKIIFVGDAAERIAEDRLRILRLFRFHALYGKGAPDAKALQACAAAAGQIAELSRERITQEFFKIISVDEPAVIFGIMFKNNVLREFHYPGYDETLLKHLCEFENRYELAFMASRLLTLAAFSLNNIKKMEALLLIPKVFKKDIEALLEVLKLPDLDADAAVKVAIYRHGRIPTAQALMIEVAQDRVMNGYAPKALKIVQKWDVPDFPVSGADLKKAGVKEGPEMGKKLRELEEWWVDGGFKADKKAVLTKI